MSEDSGCSPAQTTQPKSQASLNKACDACRSLKIRCIVSTDGLFEGCQRCTRFKQECIFAEVKKRRPRQRTDARVAELEKEVSAMRAIMGNGRIVEERPLARSNTRSSENEEVLEIPSEQAQPQGRPSTVLRAPVNKASTTGNVSQDYEPDVFDRGILSNEDAEELLHAYNEALTRHFPAVVLPPSVSVQYLRRTRPVLLLSVIAAAAGSRNPALSKVLHLELNQILATRIFLNCEKSFELVQCILVTTVFYDPPEKQGQLKFYEFFQMTASMAQDIGLGKLLGPKPINGDNIFDSNPDDPDWLANPDSHSIADNPSELERSRTFLGCYLGCVGAAITKRRLSLLHHGKSVDECIQHLSNPLHAAASDALLVAYSKLTMILEEISSTISSDDQADDVGLQEQRTQLVMKTLVKQLHSWLSQTNSELLRGELVPSFLHETETNRKGPLLIMYHSCHLFLHEIVLYPEHRPNTFLPPYRPESVAPERTTQHLPPVYIGATLNLISSAHALLDTFLCINVIDVRNLPVFAFVRSLHSILILAKLHASASNAESAFANFVDRNSLRFDFYLTAIVRHLQEASGMERLRTPTVFLMMILKFCLWYKDQQPRFGSRDGISEISGRTESSSTRWTSKDNSPAIEVSTATTSATAFGPPSVNQSFLQQANSVPASNVNSSLTPHDSYQTNVYFPQQSLQAIDSDAHWHGSDMGSVAIDTFDFPMEMDPDLMSLFDSMNHSSGYNFGSDF